MTAGHSNDQPTYGTRPPRAASARARSTHDHSYRPWMSVHDHSRPWMSVHRQCRWI
jgi:hypothetical protein